MRIVVLALILIYPILSAGSPSSADILKLPGPGGTITVDAPEIEIAPTLLKATGGAKVVLPPLRSLSALGSSESSDPEPVPVIIEAPVIEVRYPAYKAYGGVRLTQGETTSLTAEEISGDFEKDLIKTFGGTVLKQDQRTLIADQLDYNYGTQSGEISKARFQENNLIFTGEKIQAVNETLHLHSAAATTCDRLPNPHYKITASEIIVTPDRRVKARGVSVWLGGTRIIKLPTFQFSIAEGQVRRSIFPRPGYDNFNGFYLGVNIPITASERFISNLWTRWTANNGFQGKLSNEYLLSGKTVGPLTWLVTGPEVELRDRPALVPTRSRTSTEVTYRQPRDRQFRAFVDISHEERVYDVDNTRLLLDREPEVGLKYVLPGLRLSPDRTIPNLNSEGRISWGRFRESDRTDTVDRLDLRAIVAPTVIKLPADWYILPVVLGRLSLYDTDDHYSTIGLGMDVTKVIAPETFTTLRYIYHAVGGSTPLEFDDVDIRRELQGILQYRAGRNFFGLSLRYDISNSDLYDWQFTYGRTIHCLEPRITWRNKFSELSLDVKVIGL